MDMHTKDRLERHVGKVEQLVGDLALARRMGNKTLIAKRRQELRIARIVRGQLEQVLAFEAAAKLLVGSKVTKMDNDDDIIHLEFSNGMRLSLNSENFRESNFIYSKEGAEL